MAVASMGSHSRAVFVVGAGRSGTSALTRGLVALGVDLGEKLKPPTRKNPTGFFEDVDLLALAKRVRSRLGLFSESVSPIPAEALRAAELEPLRREAVAVIERRFAHKPLWGFKYAQTLRMLPFWEDVLERAGIDVAYLVASRHPISVARSRTQLDPLRGAQEKSDAEWLVNVVPYFRFMARRPFVVCDYDLFMDDPRAQLLRIAARLEIPLDSAAEERVREFAAAFLDRGMRHTRFGDADLDAEPRLNPLTRDAYRWLARLARDEVAADTPELWKDWTRIERELEAMGPLLRHIDALEARVRRTQGPLWQRLRQRFRA